MQAGQGFSAAGGAEAAEQAQAFDGRTVGAVADQVAALSAAYAFLGQDILLDFVLLHEQDIDRGLAGEVQVFPQMQQTTIGWASTELNAGIREVELTEVRSQFLSPEDRPALAITGSPEAFPAETAQVLNMFALYVSLPAVILLKVPTLTLTSQNAIAAVVPWCMLLLSAVVIQLLAKPCGWSRQSTGALMLIVPIGKDLLEGTTLGTGAALSIGGACFVAIEDRKRSTTLQIAYDQQRQRLALPERLAPHAPVDRDGRIASA